MKTDLAELSSALRTVAGMGIIATLLAMGSCLVTQRFVVGSLVWNLALAFVPLVLAVMISSLEQRGHTAIALGLGIPWILFLPNAPYILTDFIHLQVTPYRWIWGHLLLIAWCGITGLFAGLLAVRLIHPLLTRRLGRHAAWGIILAINLLTGVGVALGRFQRWNSWDMLRRPRRILGDIIHNLPSLSSSQESLIAAGFGGLFAAAYLLLHSLKPVSPPSTGHASVEEAP